MRNVRGVRVSALVELVSRDDPDLTTDEVHEDVRIALQIAGYPPDADQVAGIDAVSILERLGVGLVTLREERTTPETGQDS